MQTHIQNVVIILHKPENRDWSRIGRNADFFYCLLFMALEVASKHIYHMLACLLVVLALLAVLAFCGGAARAASRVAPRRAPAKVEGAAGAARSCSHSLSQG